LAGFRHIVNDARFLESPGCLETPKSDDLHEDVENLAALRSLVKPGRKRWWKEKRGCGRLGGDL